MIKSLSKCIALSLMVFTVSACTEAEFAALDPTASAGSITLVAAGEGSCEAWAERPELTESQHQDLQAMREAAHAQVLEVLTPEQAAQLETLKADRGPGQGLSRRPGRGPGQGRNPFEALGLTPDQEAEIERIRAASRAEMQAYFETNQITPPPRFQEGPPPDLESLDLTPEQEEQLAAIKNEARSNFLALLTPEQAVLVESTLAGGEGMRGLRGQLQLSNDQKVQLCELRQATRAEMEGILTPEQLDELKSL